MVFLFVIEKAKSMLQYSDMKEISKIMGSDARVKILRLFLFNDNMNFDVQDISDRSHVPLVIVKKELKMLHDVKFLRKKTFTKEIILKPLKTKKEQRIKKKKVSGWTLNRQFALVDPLKKLLLDPELLPTKNYPERFKGTGSLKMLAVTGLFKNDHDRKLDILLVGDKLNRKKIEKVLSVIESEIGKEIRYAIFDSEEFTYRMSMYDKLVHDVFNNDHDRLIDKMRLPQIR